MKSIKQFICLVGIIFCCISLISCTSQTTNNSSEQLAETVIFDSTLIDSFKLDGVWEENVSQEHTSYLYFKSGIVGYQDSKTKITDANAFTSDYILSKMATIKKSSVSNSIEVSFVFDGKSYYLTVDLNSLDEIVVSGNSIIEGTYSRVGEASDINGIAETNHSTITLAEFEAIKIGMTYESACNIIGSNGVLSTESGTIKIYSWDGEGSTGANALITFANGKVEIKTQSGLE